MKRIWSQPIGWMLLATLLAALLFTRRGVSPEYSPDSASYLDFSWSPVSELLLQSRTFGYPLFLEACRLPTGDLRAVPLAQLGAMLVAAWAVYWGLCKAGYRPSTAGWCAIVLMLGRAAFKLGTLVTADSLAISLAVGSAACFLATTARRPGSLAWIGLMILTFLTYQTRPAYLFLIPLWPLLSGLLDRQLLRPAAARADRWRRILIYAAVTGVPFVAFCTVRWAVVGHWGLVSFGGYNSIGVAGQFLDQELVEELPVDLQSLATGILRRQAARGNWTPPGDFLVMEQMFNPMVWELAVPTARELHPDDPVRVNSDLARLSTAVMQRRPSLYLRWLRWNVTHAFKQVVQLSVTDLGTMLVVALLLLAQCIGLMRGQRPVSLSAPLSLSVPRSVEAAETEPGARAAELTEWEVQHRESHLLFWTAFGFAAAKVLLVILVEPANDRYMTGAMALIPAACMVPAVHYFDRIWRRGS